LKLLTEAIDEAIENIESLNISDFLQ
jgi:hypothetical protein